MWIGDEYVPGTTMEEVARALRWNARYVAQANAYKFISKEETQKIYAVTELSEQLRASEMAGLDIEAQKRSLIKAMLDARPHLRKLCEYVGQFSMLEGFDEARHMLEKESPLH